LARNADWLLSFFAPLQLLKQSTAAKGRDKAKALRMSASPIAITGLGKVVNMPAMGAGHTEYCRTNSFL
jgi:hypothetical protein